MEEGEVPPSDGEGVPSRQPLGGTVRHFLDRIHDPAWQKGVEIIECAIFGVVIALSVLLAWAGLSGFLSVMRLIGWW